MTVGASISTATGRILSNLNQPVLTAGGGLAAAVAIPFLERTVVPWSILKWIHLATFAFNYWAARQPGRIDGIRSSNNSSTQPQPTDSSNKDDDADDDESSILLQQALSLRRGGTLLTPAGWAFAIWAPIFVGELASTIRALVLVDAAASEASPIVVDILQRASAGFIVAQIFQTLWAASFRPKYIPRTRSSLAETTTKSKFKRRFRQWTTYISCFHLTGIAVALSRAHAAYSPDRWSRKYNNSRPTTSSPSNGNISQTDYILHLLPMTLHFGWTTAAALVNWNGSLAMDATSSAQQVATAGIASTVLATVVGIAVTVTRQAPVYGAVLAWALAACASAMEQRIQERERQVRQVKKKLWRNNDTATAAKIRQRKGFYGAEVQQLMCRAGAAVTGAVACGVALLLQQKQRRTVGVAP